MTSSFQTLTGISSFDEDYISDTPVKVIVTFLEEVKSESDKGLSLSDFSFFDLDLSEF